MMIFVETRPSYKDLHTNLTLSDKYSSHSHIHLSTISPVYKSIYCSYGESRFSRYSDTTLNIGTCTLNLTLYIPKVRIERVIARQDFANLLLK